jgi:hypothetical protein
MTSFNKSRITPAHRAHFAAIADALIPAYGALPKASDVGVAEALLDRVLAARPDLIEVFVRGLEATAGLEGRQAAERLFRTDPDAFDAISTLAAAGYFIDQGIRDLIGYPGQESVPAEAPYAVPGYATDGSLSRVFERGPIYKPTPGTLAAKHSNLLGGKR